MFLGRKSQNSPPFKHLFGRCSIVARLVVFYGFFSPTSRSCQTNQKNGLCYMFPEKTSPNHHVKASFLDVVNTNPSLFSGNTFIAKKKRRKKKVLNSLVPKNLGLQESRLSAQPDMFYQSLEVHVARYHEVLHVSDPPRWHRCSSKGIGRCSPTKSSKMSSVEAMQIWEKLRL